MSCKTIRDERFGESANTNGKESFGKFSLEHGGFFVGEDVKARMNLIRNSILEVRKNWNDKIFMKIIYISAIWRKIFAICGFFE